MRQPLKSKDLKEPIVLVRRRESDLCGPNGEEIALFPSYPVISLFTGAGGFDLGIEQAGFCSVVQHEWDKSACETLMDNRPMCFRHAALIQGDIRNTPTGMILREGGLRVGEAYMLIGGPPCQGFTWANSNRGKERDDRNDLVLEYLRVVNEAKPRFFIMENVPGFQELHRGAYMTEFLRRAFDCYYELVYGLIDASSYGVPQCRCRFICMGTRRDVHEIEGHLATLPRPQNFGQRDLDLINSIAPGPLFEPLAQHLMQAPGIRYYPDRPVLKTPQPLASADESGGDRRMSATYIKFYRDLHLKEPDRIPKTA